MERVLGSVELAVLAEAGYSHTVLAMCWGSSPSAASIAVIVLVTVASENR